jgi:hypothetical protein
MVASLNSGRLMEPLRDEHRELLPHVEALRNLADRIGAGAAGEQRTYQARLNWERAGYL